MAVHSTFLHRLDALTVRWTVFSYGTNSSRQGLLLRLKGSNEQTNWGEIAPFPGRSKESYAQALAQLLELLRTGQTQEALFPSVQFGLESALSPRVVLSAPLYALLSGSEEEIIKQAQIAVAQGYTTVKLKISSFSLDTAQRIIHHLKRQFRIRIDCNSFFSFAEATELFSPFERSTFDYIEDPIYEIDRLPEFSHPFALDETVLQYASLPVEDYRNLYGFILKPTILGGEKGCRPIIEFAQKRKLKVVFSSSFESELGLLQILSLAGKFDLLAEPLGLDTYRYLRQDLLKPPVNFCTPHITVGTALEINLDKLMEIAHGTCELSNL